MRALSFLVLAAAMAMSSVVNADQQGNPAQTIESLKDRAAREPGNPEAWYMIAVYHWEEAYRNARLRDDEKMEQVNLGLQAIDRALELEPEYVDALVYKGLLLRVQAGLERNASTREALLREADQLQGQAVAIHGRRTTGN